VCRRNACERPDNRILVSQALCLNAAIVTRDLQIAKYPVNVVIA
jgi:PIN domain nuclease of toxin-antitoxin system